VDKLTEGLSVGDGDSRRHPARIGLKGDNVIERPSSLVAHPDGGRQSWGNGLGLQCRFGLRFGLPPWLFGGPERLPSLSKPLGWLVDLLDMFVWSACPGLGPPPSSNSNPATTMPSTMTTLSSERTNPR
jgi:hypothetical protein